MARPAWWTCAWIDSEARVPGPFATHSHVTTVLDPWTHALGTRDGRLQPTASTPADGSWVLALGEDADPGTSWQLGLGDATSVEQYVDLTGVELITVRARTRQPTSMPTERDLQGSPEDVELHATVAFGGTTLGAAIELGDASFTAADEGASVTIANASNPSNDGAAILLAILSGKIALVDRSFIAEGPTSGMTVILAGGRYVGRLYVDGVLRATVLENPGWTRDRLDVVAHVSKLTGVHAIKFELALVDAGTLP